MTKIPTAEEIILKNFNHDKNGDYKRGEVAIKDALIEFAKLHVEAALEAASDTDILSGKAYKHRTNLDMDTIMNSYPLDKIK